MQAQPDQASNLNLNDRLKEYTWQKRVLLIVSPSEKDKKYLEQKEMTESEPGDLQERDLEIITLLADKLSQADKAYLDKKFSLDYSRFNVILIGKDGGAKRTDQEPITRQELFETIDAMPMRKAEMKKNKE